LVHHFDNGDVIIFVGFFSFLFNSQAWATVPFHCYSFPNVPVQVYEYGSSNCGGMNSAAAEKNLGKNLEKVESKKDILCMYQAACRPVDPSVANQVVPKKTQAEIMNALSSGDMKGSILVCKGVGLIGENGKIENAECEQPTQCQRDVFYNYNVNGTTQNRIESVQIKTDGVKGIN
jgi:hypothetical protein